MRSGACPAEQKFILCAFAAWGCEGPENCPVDSFHRATGRQALDVEDARGKGEGVPERGF